MTNQEAITKLTNIMHDDHYAWHPSILTAFNMAVDALRGAEGNCISRQILKEAFVETSLLEWEQLKKYYPMLKVVDEVPSAQPEIIRCKDCIYYDPPHVKNNGVRYEYDEMPADAFDALGTGLVNAEYGINIGGRCCVDYYCKNYSDDKRVFVREDNYCGRAERRTDD